MKKFLYPLIFTALFVFAAGHASAQRNIELAIDHDPIMEADAKHNLDVAKQAFHPKKAYKQVLLRFEETFAAYPEFSQMEEFLYIAAMSSYYLSKNQGRQKVNLKNPREAEKFAPEKLRADTIVYFRNMLERFPQSRYKGEAEKILKELGSES